MEETSNQNIEGSILRILYKSNDITPIKVRHFLKFLLSKGVYTPYIGRLMTSEWRRKYNTLERCEASDLLVHSFIWNPDHHGEKYRTIGDMYFNKMLCARNWSDLSNDWHNHIICNVRFFDWKNKQMQSHNIYPKV